MVQLLKTRQNLKVEYIPESLHIASIFILETFLSQRKHNYWTSANNNQS